MITDPVLRHDLVLSFLNNHELANLIRLVGLALTNDFSMGFKETEYFVVVLVF